MNAARTLRRASESPPHARARRIGALLCLIVLCGLLATPARADEPHTFHTNARLEAPLLATGMTAWILSEILKPKLAPSECRLCGTDRFDGSIRDAVRWSNVAPARHLSDALLFGVVPVAAFGSMALLASASHATHGLSTDMLMLVETLVLTADLTQLTKFSVARERPYAYAERVDHQTSQRRADDELSFFSGHTSITFSLAVAAGTTASLRGYRHAPLVWAIGMPLAALTGYFRMAADKHYFTDVLTGALVGSAVGFLVPWLHTLTRSSNPNMPAMMVSPPGTVSFSWVR